METVTPLLLRLPQVSTMIGLSKSQIYRLINSGEFPAPTKLGENSVAWPTIQVHAWVAAKIEASKTESQI
ncbi:AlpA family phage regulatory protein [Pseudomonas sp. FSL R10-0399]|uniref:helix-turn-helix transcriptional regulator n=1 Tax=Pseudomonas sp. FSL R10-0399 TaxID=2662194 RepID=UPI00129563F0|nr:AlpA family transcriptional regulator [Pseudomonas sp. FSL R10-0399]MQT58034.1 AlpA family phage regulatory protein [Pseudomonas sp. FSL R10-0399]